jgi:hypothetical protein
MKECPERCAVPLSWVLATALAEITRNASEMPIVRRNGTASPPLLGFSRRRQQQSHTRARYWPDKREQIGHFPDRPQRTRKDRQEHPTLNTLKYPCQPFMDLAFSMRAGCAVSAAAERLAPVESFSMLLSTFIYELTNFQREPKAAADTSKPKARLLLLKNTSSRTLPTHLFAAIDGQSPMRDWTEILTEYREAQTDLRAIGHAKLSSCPSGSVMWKNRSPHSASRGAACG